MSAGEELTDFAKMLEKHPAPWVYKETRTKHPIIMDSRNILVTFIDGAPQTIRGIIAAVNMAARMQP